MAREKARAVCAGEKAEILRVGLACDREPRTRRDPAHLLLVELPERESQPRERPRRERRKRVALILRGVGGDLHEGLRGLRLAVNARVVAGGERGGPQPVGELEHRVEAHAAVAAQARVWGEAARVIGEPGLDHTRAELGAEVDREMRHVEAVSERARRARRLR